MIRTSARARFELFSLALALVISSAIVLSGHRVEARAPNFDGQLAHLKKLIASKTSLGGDVVPQGLRPTDFETLEALIELSISADKGHPGLTAELWTRVYDFLRIVSGDEAASVTGLMKLGKRVGVRDGTDTNALFMLGVLYSYMGHSDGAAGMLNALKDRFPRSSGVVWYRAMNNFRSGNSEIALEILYDERFADRMDRRSHYLHAEILRDRDAKGALKSLDQASASPVLGVDGEPTPEQLKRVREQLTVCSDEEHESCRGQWLYPQPVSQGVVPEVKHRNERLRTDLTPQFFYKRGVGADR